MPSAPTKPKLSKVHPRAAEKPSGDGDAADIAYGPDEAARLLRIGRSALYELLAQGKIRSFKIGKSRRLLREDLVAYARSLVEKQAG